MNTSNNHGRLRLSVPIRFETTDRSEFDLHFDIEERMAQHVPAELNELLPMLFLVAWHAGEAHVRTEFEVCAALCHRLKASVGLLRHWYPYLGEPPRLDVSTTQFLPGASASAGSQMMSGGVDSLSAFRINRTVLRADHPEAAKLCISVRFSLDPRKEERRERLRACCASLGADYTEVHANVLELRGSGYFYDQCWHGAVLAGIGSLFCKGFGTCGIASSFNSGYLMMPWGSHPMLDPNYSSSRYTVHHSDTGLTRLEKVRALTNWHEGLRALHVCQKSKSPLNCGKCEKCTLTKLELLAVDGLDNCEAFPEADLSVGDVTRLCDYDYPMIQKPSAIQRYRELVGPLDAIGRSDLAGAVKQVVRFYNEMFGQSVYADRGYRQQ